MSVPIICKFDEDPIKMKSLSPGQHFSDPKSNSSKILWLSSLPVSLMKIDQKWNRYRPDSIFLSLWGPQGQATLMPRVETGPKSNLSEMCACPRDLQVWWRSDQKWSRLCPDKITSLLVYEWSDLSQKQTRPRFYGCSHCLQVWWRFDQN